MILIRENVERHTDDPAYAKALISQGYKLIDGEIKEKPAEKSLEKMTVKELKALAKVRGLKGADGFTKKELLEVLSDDEPEEVENGSDNGTEGEDPE